MVELALIPVTGIRLREAFDTAWQVLKPSDDDLLREREDHLSAVAEDTSQPLSVRARCREALTQARPRKLAAAAFAAREFAKPAFVAALWSGALRARQLIDGHEMEVGPGAWLRLTFDEAARMVPALYLDRPQFDSWLRSADTRECRRPAFNDLVRFFLERMPPAPTRLPSDPDDISAARDRFGDTVSRDLIRDARREAYRDRMPKPGRPMT